jgi:hypothetical protein
LNTNCLKVTQKWIAETKGTKFIDVNSLIWAWSQEVGWKGKIIKINGKEFDAIEAHQEQFG